MGNCKMADASRGPGRPPKKRSGSKKAENVPGAKLQKSQREKGRRVRKYLMEQSKVKEQGTEQGDFENNDLPGEDASDDSMDEENNAGESQDEEAIENLC